MRRQTTLIRRRVSTVGAVLVLVLAGAAPIANAQDNAAVEDLRQEVRSLNRDVEALRQDVQRTRVATRTDDSSVPPTVAAQFEVRLSQLERTLQDLTGKVEEVAYNVRLMNERLERLKNDLEYRLSELEGGQPGTRRQADAGQPQNLERQQQQDQQAARNQQQSFGQAQNTGGNEARSTDASLPAGSPSEQYAHAIDQLRRQDYAGAEQTFTAYIEEYPDGALTANAFYWLGETYYVQQRFREAAVQFADGYRRFGDHAYAPRNLLRLSMSLARLDRQEDACQSLAELRRSYPDVGSHIRRTAETERRRLGCH